jgi:hypothetical protein
MNYLSMAIYSLCPDSEFTFTNGDYSTIEWIKREGNAPTQAEIDAEIATIKAKEITDKEAAATAKEIAQAKFTALGLTLDDLKALGL